MIYDTQGTYIALAGILVQLLAHYGVIVQSTDIVNAIGGLIVFVGIIKQFIAHKALAKASGVVR